MRVPALSLLLTALATPSVAAAPADRETTARVRYTDAHPVARPAAGWVELADATPAAHGKVFIQIDPDLGPLRRLRLDAAHGRPRITRVRIDFVDGTSRVVRVDRCLRPGHTSLVDLRTTRPITQIVVFSERRLGGSYTVHGERTSAVAFR